MTWEHPETLLPRIAAPFMPFASILDVGGGPGTVGKDNWGTDNIHVLDLWIPETMPKNFRRGNGLDIERLYGAKSFDLVLCSEVIEHLSKADGSLLMHAVEAVARKLVVFTTPNGFKPQVMSGEKWNENPYQVHLCGYSMKEFSVMGYETLLNGEEQIIAWKPC